MRRLRPKKLFPLTVFFFYLGIRTLLVVGIWGEGIFLGLGCMVISFLLFLTIGGMRGETEPPFEDSARYRECYLGMAYDLENKLQREKEQKEFYQKELKETKKTALEGIGIFLVGVLINLLSMFFDMLISDSFLPVLPIGRLAGCYVEFFGLTWVFGAYVNSSLPFAKEISETFMLHTNSVKIEECSKMIAVIRNKLREQENKRKELEREYYSQIKGEGEYGNLKNGEFV